MNIQRRILAVAAAAVTTVLLSACGGPGGSSAGGGDADSTPMTFMYSPYADYAPFFVAEGLGYYDDAGLDVELVAKGGSSGETFQHVSTGNVTGGGASWAAGLFNATNTGASISVVAGMSRIPDSGRNPSPLMASEQSGITDASQLKGKKVGVPGKGGFGIYSIHLALESVGLTLEDVELVNLSPGDIIPAMANGAIDASWTIEPVSSAIAKEGIGHEILDIDYQAGTELGLMIFNSAFVESNPDDVAAFVAATLRAVTELNDGGWNDPKVQALISEYTDLPTDVLTSLALTEADVDGSINWEDVAAQERFFQERGVLEYEGEVDIKSVYRGDIREKAVEQLAGILKTQGAVTP